MFCVGLTGNIASGKSTVAELFRTLGVHVLSADNIARELTLRGQPALHLITNHFGDEVLSATGDLDRALLREKIFKTPKERLWLEQLLHPLIREEIITELNKVTASYAVIEIPLLIKREDYPYLNRILVVIAEPKQQIERVIHRDNCSREQALAILASQPDELSRQKIADDLIFNNGSIAELKNNIIRLHHDYLQFAVSQALD